MFSIVYVRLRGVLRTVRMLLGVQSLSSTDDHVGFQDGKGSDAKWLEPCIVHVISSTLAEITQCTLFHSSIRHKGNTVSTCSQHMTSVIYSALSQLR